MFQSENPGLIMKTNGGSIITGHDHTIEFPNFEAFLKTCFGNDIDVLSFKVVKFVPFGENFCSLMGKIEAVIRRSGDQKEEKLQLVAKMAGEFNNYPVDWKKLFVKEVFFYNVIIPTFRELELKMGVPYTELFDKAPRFFGYRNSLNPESKQIDSNSLILLEDLRASNYYMGDRQIGLDLNHAKIVVRCIARFHAIGIAVKRKHPDRFDQLKSKGVLTGIKMSQIQRMFNKVFQVLHSSKLLVPFIPKLKSMIENHCEMQVGKKSDCSQLDDLWTGIAHGDLRLSNLMFHKDKLGDVDDVKFYDFPMFLYHSVLYDLTYFLNSALDKITFAEHYDELIDLYYDNFIATVKAMSCESDEFTRQSFDRELEKMMIDGFGACLCLIKVSTSKVEKEGVDKNPFDTVLEEPNVDENFFDKVIELIKKYKQHGWW